MGFGWHTCFAMNTPASLPPHPSQRWLQPGPWAWVAWAIAAIVATSFIYNAWMLDARSFFYADDWQWLARAEFFPWSDAFHRILPGAAYNDRPVGAAVVKALYGLFGLNHRAFQIAQLSLHAINCTLLYAIATRYIGRSGALLAALLAAVWFSANAAVGWVAAIFDLAGATLCLAVIALRQTSRRSGDVLRYDLAGAACYVLAIRTKEFALGMIVVLFLMNILVERQSLRATFRQLWPYLAVFLVFAARYAQLLHASPPPGDSPYHLEWSLPSVVSSLGFYVKAIFHRESGAQPMIAGGMVVAMGAAMLLAEDRVQRAALWSLSTFVILLGPVLLLPAHLDPLYLYAPHFFLSLTIGAMLTPRVASIALVAIVVAGVTILPNGSGYRRNVIEHTLRKEEANHIMFSSAVKLLTPLPPGATVFISGVPPAFNLFSIPSGNSLNTAFRDFNLEIVTERPESELATKFCKTEGVKRFLRFQNMRPVDVTAEIAGRCDVPKQG